MTKGDNNGMPILKKSNYCGSGSEFKDDVENDLSWRNQGDHSRGDAAKAGVFQFAANLALNVAPVLFASLVRSRSYRCVFYDLLQICKLVPLINFPNCCKLKEIFTGESGRMDTSTNLKGHLCMFDLARKNYARLIRINNFRDRTTYSGWRGSDFSCLSRSVRYYYWYKLFLN
ncbi:hypothetical protein BJ742DRAFT_402009 [Cladochytrium replicatum]|nr:hypothetical protein BJ742DRAFT_402009 [Cladochytrium replicatum]